MDIIKVNNLDVGYGKFSVLRDLNFTISTGEITVVVGTSGCGKSTLMKTLIGLIPPLKGDLHIGGQRIDFRYEESLKILYKKIGVLYQNSALLNSLTVFENVALPVRMEHPVIPGEVLERMVDIRLSQVNLGDSGDKYPSELSGGMRKRAALARALILEPEIIFCDEPSAGLDPVTSSGLDELLLSLKQISGMTVVAVTHELRSIEKIADRIIVLEDGKMRYSGDFKGVFALGDAFIESFFLRKGKDGN
ncbi:MAG: ATP-binding cassette domain-containing protein [Candidatus Aminicenantes bacterium]|nr:ATP-binding cassette domain-containing protein [Candidatus Aminicenantes bacterium]